MLTAILIVHFNAGTQDTSRIVASSPSPSCRSGDPLAGVYNPLRFRVLSKCEVASGTVESASLQDGSDQRIAVGLASQYTKLLDVGNVKYQNGLLVLELSPQGQTTVSVPSLGEQITFVGPLVYDSDNHWNAISPVWSIRVD
jgi:hypothetical protein